MESTADNSGTPTDSSSPPPRFPPNVVASIFAFLPPQSLTWPFYSLSRSHLRFHRLRLASLGNWSGTPYPSSQIPITRPSPPLPSYQKTGIMRYTARSTASSDTSRTHLRLPLASREASSPPTSPSLSPHHRLHHPCRPLRPRRLHLTSHGRPLPTSWRWSLADCRCVEALSSEVEGFEVVTDAARWRELLPEEW